MPELRILFVEDSEDDYLLVQNALRQSGAQNLVSARVDNELAMTEALSAQDTSLAWHAVISDYQMPRFSAMGALNVVKRLGLDLPFIIVSGTIGEETAVNAMKAGAHDYLMKSKLSRLLPAIERELREHRDRRKLRENEELLRQSQKMETVGMLAGGVAHDFNNILTVILMHCDGIISDTTAAPEDSPLRKMLYSVDQIQKSAYRAAALTRQLLTFSRKQVLEPEILDLNSVVTHIRPMIDRLIGEKIEVSLSLSPGLHTIRADLGQIEQLIMNLAVNARDAMPDGGKLHLSTANAEGPSGTLVAFTVGDTGCGMDETIQKRIFEPFFTTKGPDKGTGLGLSTVYGIVEQSQARIAVESSPGKGARFRIEFPRVDATAPVAVKETKKAKLLPRQGIKVLLMEDQVEVRDVLRDTLRDHGIESVCPESCEEAIRLFGEQKSSIQLLITDVILPGMSGPTLARRLLESSPALEVLFISGYLDDEPDMRQVVEQGHFLQKPFSPSDFIRKIQEILSP